MARRNNIPNLIFQIFFKRGDNRVDSSKETKIDKIDTGPYIIPRMKIIRFPFIFKRGSRVIGRWSPLPNPLLRGADSFALISCHGFLPAHNETVRAERYALAHSRCDSSGLVLAPADARSLPGMRSRKRAREGIEVTGERKREGKKEKEEKEIFDWWSALYAEEKKKESLRPAQLRIRTSPSILITGHGRKEFVKILNVRAFFRADN